MQENRTITGGCLCGALRYQARGEPRYAGYCCCADCRKASGSGFVPFLGYGAAEFSVSGETRIFRSIAARGGITSRNFCPNCGSLVFGGEVGVHDEHTLYAGSLDDPSGFKPMMAIFTRERPDGSCCPPACASSRVRRADPVPTAIPRPVPDSGERCRPR